MTLGLGRWLPVLAVLLPGLAGRQAAPLLDISSLPARDLADLNLPPALAGRLLARQTAEDLRRSYRP